MSSVLDMLMRQLSIKKLKLVREELLQNKQQLGLEQNVVLINKVDKQLRDRRRIQKIIKSK